MVFNQNSLSVSDKLWFRAHMCDKHKKMVGPVGLEPTTKGFT